MAEEGKSGKRVVGVLLGLVLVVGVVAWLGAMRLEKGSGGPRGDTGAEIVSALSEGVLYEAQAGDPGIVVAKEVGAPADKFSACGEPPTVPVLLNVVSRTPFT